MMETGMNKLTVRAGIGLAVVTLFITTVSIFAQMEQEFAQAQQANARALRKYTWKSRTEIQKSGDTRSVQLNLMRYDISGALQKTLMSTTPQQQLPTRGVRGRIAQKKKEDFLDTLSGLEKLGRSYSELSPDKMQRFMTTATRTPEEGPQQKLVRIKGNDVVQPGDSLTWWMDAATRKLRKIEIQTALDRKLVRVASDFRDLPNGPTYMARSVTHYASEELTVITENFDYEQVAQ
jgi:hypothetical protein